MYGWLRSRKIDIFSQPEIVIETGTPKQAAVIILHWYSMNDKTNQWKLKKQQIN